MERKPFLEHFAGIPRSRTVWTTTPAIEPVSKWSTSAHLSWLRGDVRDVLPTAIGLSNPAGASANIPCMCPISLRRELAIERPIRETPVGGFAEIQLENPKVT